MIRLNHPAAVSVVVTDINKIPARVKGGGTFTLRLALNRIAGRGGAVVYLKSGDPARVRLPRQVRILVGSGA